MNAVPVNVKYYFTSPSTRLYDWIKARIHAFLRLRRTAEASTQMSEKQNRPFRLSFNPSLQGDFHGLRVTSDGGLLQVRDLFGSLNP
jgi:hypothetical protein